MKTSYQFKNIEKENTPESISLADTYKEAQKVKEVQQGIEKQADIETLKAFQEKASRVQQPQQRVSPPARTQQSQSQKKEVQVNKPVNKSISKAPNKPKNKQKPKKKGHTGLLIVFSILLVAIIGFGGFLAWYTFGSNSTNSISKKISALYTSSEKVDISENVYQKDINTLYEELKGKKQTKEVTALESELDSIGYYIQDRDSLSKYEDSSFNLTTAGMTDDVDAIKNGTSRYTIGSLASTISDRATKILTEYDDFINLRLELQGITDVKNFDEDKYATLIDNISHTPNKEELSAIIDTIKADKAVSEAQAKVDSASNDIEKSQAQAELDTALNGQKETQSKLEEIQKSQESSEVSN